MSQRTDCSALQAALQELIEFLGQVGLEVRYSAVPLASPLAPRFQQLYIK